LIYSSSVSPGIWIRMDLRSIGTLDRIRVEIRLDPDPYETNGDPKHCISVIMATGMLRSS
jgi:hypothetical protein